MKKVLLIWAFLLLSKGLVIAQNIETQHISKVEQKRAIKDYNTLKSLLPHNYDLKYCSINWSVDPAVRFIAGNIQYFFLHDDSLSHFNLELSDSLTVDSVIFQTLNLNFIHQNNLLSVPFMPYLQAGQLDSIRVYYHGVPNSSSFGSFETDVHGPNNVPVLWTLSEPYGARDWWPVKQDMNDKIDSLDIFVNTPVAYKVASNGVLVGETINASIKTTHWKHRYPIAAYLVAFGVSDYNVFTQQAQLSTGILDVINYVYNEDSTEAQIGINTMLNHLVYFDSLFVPYPFMNEKYGHLQFNWGGGMEHQTISFVGGFSYELLAHELAHQWFGDMVTTGSWQELWLNEGFASYCTGLCYERFSPQLYWKIWKSNQIDFITSSPGGSVFATDTNDVSLLFDARLRYSKAAMLLHMIRFKIGDTHFFNAIRNYLSNPLFQYAYARTSDLKSELESESNQNLNEFFNDWYWGEGYPSYQLQYHQDMANSMQFTLNQTQSHPSVSFFEMPVPIKFKNSSSDTTIIFDHFYSGQSFSFQLPFQADSVIIDPDQWLVCKDNVVTETRQVQIRSQIKAFPNPGLKVLNVYLPENDQSEIEKITYSTNDGKTTPINKNILEKSSPGKYKLDVSFLSTGFYTFAISTHQSSYYFQFVKL